MDERRNIMTTENKLDIIIESQAHLKTQQAVMCVDMKHIIKDNAEFKETTNKNVTTLKADYYKTKTIVERHSIWFTVIHFITVTLLGIFGFKSM